MKNLIVSICIVARNEEQHINRLLEDIVMQDYSHNRIEVVLIDSISEDATKRCMLDFKKKYSKNFYSIQVLCNEKKTQAAGWNVAINNYKGEIISRIDAHTRLSHDFVYNVVDNINSGEYVVGGVRPCILEDETEWKRTLLAVENSLFGSGINKSRYSIEKCYVKTMFHASYKREVFENVGLFNEFLLRTEDNEMHYRIRKFGYKLCYDPNIKSYQLIRSSFINMIKQKYSNGYWVGITLWTCPDCLQIHHFVPLIFVEAFVLFLVMLVCGFSFPLFLLCFAYGLFCVINLMLCLKDGVNLFKLLMPILFFILHFSYGIGTFLGIIKNFCRRYEKNEIRK